MNAYLYDLISNSGALSLNDVVIRIVFSMVMGLVIYVSYWLTHIGTIYSKKFNVTLFTLTVLTAMVMTVIGNNIALSLGMVGALSIIRFRTSIKDSRDTAYIFWSIIIGICSGVGDYLVAAIGSAAVFLVLLLFGVVKSNNKVLLIVRGKRQQESDIRQIVFTSFPKPPQLKVCNSTKESIEMIFELSKGMLDKSQAQEKKNAAAEKKEAQTLLEKLYALDGIEYVNLVLQNDEIV